MNSIIKYKNGNYNVIFDLNSGTKIRSNDLDFLEAEFPESMDVKITNQCDMGCPMCHEDSKPDGKHADLMNAKFIESLHPYTELACLSGDTVVHGEHGSIDIKDLNIGDKIYDSEYALRTVVNIQKTNKDTYQVKGQRGINIKCSDDHPFIVNGEQVQSKNLVGKNIDCLKIEGDKNKEYIIDMSKHILYPNPDIKGSRGGKILEDGRIMLRHNTSPIPRYIRLTNELMWAFGLYVAEGDSRYYTLNINEKNFANRVGQMWVDTFNTSYYSVQEHEDTNSLNLSLSPQTLMRELFVSEMMAGKGARNKNLSYLYHINNKELVRWALIGLIDGDGCFRRRQGRKTKNMYCSSLKTTSKKLAYDFSYLLMKWFGIKTTIYHGCSPERKIEGRILASSDYYMVDIYGYEDCKKLFGDYYGDLTPTAEPYRRAYDIIQSVEKVENEILYDITLDEGNHIFPINGYLLTHNCGGGNPLSHPDLIPFLEKCKKLQLIPSMTVNQKHFEDNIDYIKSLVNKKLIYGLGVSLTNATDKFISEIKQFPNAVIHLINGIHSISQIEKLKNNGLKVLILGYKEFRRGEKLYSNEESHKAIDIAKNALYEALAEIINNNWFSVVSFDNLAIKQLEPQRLVSKEKWDEMYMGDDGFCTMFIDMVEKQFAKSSTEVDRYYIKDNIKDMFDIIKTK